MREPAEKRSILLFAAPAGRADRRIALSVILASSVLFVAAVPFARVQLAPVWPFIPAYESALAISDLITATLLYIQFAISTSPAILILAAGYLFCACMTLPHALSFPGLFSATGLLGAGPQTTAWLFVFWHASLPLAVIAYAVVESKIRTETASPRVAGSILASIGVAIALTCLLTWLATAGASALPDIMRGNAYTPAAIFILGGTCLLNVAGALAVCLRRRQSILDLWLTAVMFAWIFDVALSAVLNHGRFDVGFYAGRAYGLVAANIVLVMLLLETGVLYTRLARTLDTRQRGHRMLLREAQSARDAAVSALDAAEQARDAAVSADRAKSRFVATASHDLRQPLHAMNLFISALRRRVSGDEAMRLIDGMASAASSMQGMFNALLDVSKLDAGAIDPSFADFPLEHVLRNLRTAFVGPAAAKHLTLDIPPAKAVVRSDPVLLESILRNLISNAIRYTREGEVEVTCDTDGDRVGIAVRDTGPGIPADQHAAIFEEFRRLDQATQSERGLGLGLAIVRRMAGLLDAEISLESDIGRGSIFRVRVPQAQWDDVVVGADSGGTVSLTGRRLLLVDDDPLVRAALSAEIADWGAETIVASSPEQVLGLLSIPGQTPPELAIIDRDLGSPMNGPALLGVLKESFGLSLPAVIVTGATDPETLEDLRQSGYPWITKPIDVGALRGIVSELLPPPVANSVSHAVKLRGWTNS